MARRAGKKPPSALLNKVKAAATGANGASAVNGNASTVRPAKEEDPAVKEQRERQQSLENRQLASKEAALFKQLLTLYETKQHKKGVKTAEQILKKYPNHGETLAIKALIIHSSLPYNHPTASSQPKGEEAEATIATALRKDPHSHIVHHVKAIMCRASKDFRGSAVALRRARELDPDNVPLIRDAISLFAQLGEHEESLRARHQYFMLRPNLRGNWIILAVGHELVGDYEEALKVYQGFADISQEDGLSPLERGELALHVVKCMVKAGKLKEALEKLEDDVHAGVLPFEAEAIEVQASILAQLDRIDEAEVAYRKLLDGNPDKLGNYRDLFALRGIDIQTDAAMESLSTEQRNKALLMLDGFQESFPRAIGPKRLALDIAQGDDFIARARAYLVAGFERAIPSLFVDVKGLYRDRTKLEAVERLLIELQGKWEAEASTGSSEGSSAEVAPPTALLWLYYYLALHFSYPLHPSPSHKRSLELLDRALAHTPTLPELYMARAKILKRAGDPEGAARAMESARLLDGQDRFLNGKAAKYWIRAGQISKANDMLGLFTKKDAASPGQDLLDMQCLWYLVEEGDAYLRQGQLAHALKRYRQVLQVFEDIDADRYDFHTYAPRKMTLNAYFQCVDWEKTFRANARHVHSALSACRILLRVHDDPSLREEKLSPEEEAERKRLAKKARQAENKAKKASATPAGGDADNKKDEPALPDSDPEGAKYMKDVEPLSAAASIVDTLLRLPGPRSAELSAMAAEIAARQGKIAYAVQRLLAAYQSQPENTAVHVAAIRVALASQQEAVAHADVVRSALTKVIPEGMDLLRFNAELAQRHAGDAKAQLESAKALHSILLARSTERALSEQDKDNVVGMLGQVASADVTPDSDVYREALTYAVSLGASEEQREALIAKIRQRMPLGMSFASVKEIVERREAWAKEDEAAKVEE